MKAFAHGRTPVSELDGLSKPEDHTDPHCRRRREGDRGPTDRDPHSYQSVFLGLSGSSTNLVVTVLFCRTSWVSNLNHEDFFYTTQTSYLTVQSTPPDCGRPRNPTVVRSRFLSPVEDLFGDSTLKDIYSSVVKID